jgi:GT2 family glycosyltransferase
VSLVRFSVITSEDARHELEGPLSVDIAVAVATCGQPDKLARCLQALADQTLRPAETIVVDQAASEETRRIAADIDLPSVRYLEQPRLGLSASRNLALRSASEDTLAVTDDDCVPDCGWLAAVSDALERHPNIEAVTGRVLPLGDPIPGTHAISLRDSNVPVDYAGRQPPWVVGSGGNFAARISLLRACGGWDERLGVGSEGQAGEDTDLLYRLLLTGATVRYEPAAIVRHERRSLERRIATRWSYGYGVGAMCGLWLARRDLYAFRALYEYARLHLGPLLHSLRRRDRIEVGGRTRALASVIPGVIYGLRVARLPSSDAEAGPA